MIRAFMDTLRGSLHTLRANKLRSALTLLGIVIGVVAVVSMAATIEGLKRQISQDLQQLGSDVFQVQKEKMNGGGPRERAKYERRKNFTLADVQMLQQKCASCAKVGGEAWHFGETVLGPEGTSGVGVSPVGGTVEFFDNNGYGLASGRFFNEGEAQHGADVVVLGSDVVDVLFPKSSAIGQIVRVKNHPFRVVGTLERRGSTMGGSIDNIAVVPISTFLLLYGSKQSLHVTIEARDPARISKAEDEVVALLRKSRGVPPEADNDFEMFSNASVQETFDNISTIVASASVGICAIALLIGGIGVMNIMLVAVTERTSEIGVRRALGARRRRILAQFVAEAVMLTSAGGLLGIALGAGIAFIIKVLVDIPTVVPAWAIILSMSSAGGVGLVFGIYPAWRASRLDPVEAMRHE